jgi:hypothetical protein
MIDKLLNKLFGHKNAIDENIGLNHGEYKFLDDKDMKSYEEVSQLLINLETRLVENEKTLLRFAKSIQNLELLFNPSDITNMYFDKSSTLNYLVELMYIIKLKY